MNRSKLLVILNTFFNDNELRTLCFDLSIDYDNIPGTTKLDKARELILYCERHVRYDDLVKAVFAARPLVVWDEAAVSPPSSAEPPSPP